MRPHLADPAGDLALERPAAHLQQVASDLGLETLVAAMARGDGLLADVARDTLLAPVTDPAVIRHRQAVLRDCIAEEAVVRDLYQVTRETAEGERRHWSYGLSRPSSIVHSSAGLLAVYAASFRRLRAIAASSGARFGSPGFWRFFETIERELDDDYLRSIDAHVARLRDPRGVVMSGRLGRGGRATDLVLRRRPGERRPWRDWLGLREPDSSVYEVAPRDEAGAATLTRMADSGLASTAVALAAATAHVRGYFAQLRVELAFYLGALNLHDALVEKGEPVCFPEPLAGGRPTLEARGLYDPALGLLLPGRAVGNDIDADGRSLLVMTGANGGGKSTLLRAVGLAQLMMQAGLFVAGESFRADCRDAVLTHFRREEDPDLERGKLDEELARMSATLDHATSRSLLLLNESLASTSEREGSEIARGIVRALVERGVKVGYVTHLFELADGLRGDRPADALFLRAERDDDGTRSFRLVEALPLPTSYGLDIYRRVFAEEAPARGEAVDEADPGVAA